MATVYQAGRERKPRKALRIRVPWRLMAHGMPAIALPGDEYAKNRL